MSRTIYLLDTDYLSLMIRGTVEGALIQSRLRALSPDDYGISIITYAEQAKGWLAIVARATTPETEAKAFRQLQQSLSYCTAFAIWEYTQEAAEQCAELKKLRLRLGTQDLRIASIALTQNATVLTRNTSHFSRVPGLVIEDWTAK